MGRISSIGYAPAVTRKTLRNRFTRFLDSDRTISTPRRGGNFLSDEAMLQLLQSLAIDFGSDLSKARALYASALSSHSKEPTFDELIDAGWIDTVWDRVSTSHLLARFAESNQQMRALGVFLKQRFDETYRVIYEPRGASDLSTVTRRMLNKEIRLDQIGCQTPAWVAGRLWERLLNDRQDPSTALRVWFDFWRKLGHPSLVPGRVWDKETSRAFQDAAFAVLEADPAILGWDETRTDLIKKQCLTTSEDRERVAARVPSVPESLVDRVPWIFDWTDHDRMQEYGDIAGLVSILIAETEEDQPGPVPHPNARRLIELATERAHLFFFLMFRGSHSAAFLTDLLLSPSTSGVACLLISQWNLSAGGLDRELIERDNISTKSMAFADAVSVFSYFLSQGEVAPSEAASLVDRLHGQRVVGVRDHAVSGEHMISTLMGELDHQPRDVLRTMVETLSASSDSGLGTSNFASALDVVDHGGLADEVEPSPLIQSYVNSIAAGAPTLSAHRLGVGGAVTLVKLASRAPSELFRKFLYPINIEGRLGERSEDEWYASAFELAHQLRVQIRVLSRAVAGLGESAQEETVAALIAAIRQGALEDQEMGRIAAFAPHYEVDVGMDRSERSIAVDIGEAIAAVGEDAGERVLSAVLETDEPTVLAQMIELSPYATRERIQKRIEELMPSEAGDVLSLSDVQTRIEALLSAGLADAAESYIEVESQLETLGRVAGRNVERLGTRLRLHWLRGEWKTIASVVPPTGLSQAEHESAVEVIAYFQAVAAASDPNGDSEYAETVFARLQRERPDVPARALNLFGARIDLLLRDEAFRLLKGKELIRGRQILDEAEDMMQNAGGTTTDIREVFICNKALLLLALGQAEQANELLSPLRRLRVRDTTAAYSAVALARLQRGVEANAVLEHAVRMVGDTEVLQGASAHIKSNASYSMAVGQFVPDGVIGRVRAAVSELQSMDHVGQARVLELSGSVDKFVIDHVRSAATSLIELVPMMRGVKIDSCEDDLNALIRELLTQRVQFLGWSVADQSKGGFTASGNAGERDLIIKRRSATVSVVEAMICGRGRGGCRRNLRRHFHRLLAYSTCDMYFLIAYSYVDRPSEVLQTMREVAREDSPQGVSHRRIVGIVRADSGPPGFIAYYGGEWNEIKVVFLALDMRQEAQRRAVAQET